MQAIAGMVVVAARLSGCGKSKAEKDAEKAAADARYDAAERVAAPVDCSPDLYHHLRYAQ